MISLKVPAGARRAERVAAVDSGAPGVLEHAGGSGPTGPGNRTRSSLCFSGEAADDGSLRDPDKKESLCPAAH